MLLEFLYHPQFLCDSFLKCNFIEISFFVAVNKLNKQPRTADEGWSSSLGVGRGANNPSP